MRSARAAWDILGRVDHAVGRLQILRWIGLTIGGVVFLIWAVLLNRFGVLGTFVFIAACLFVAVGLVGLVLPRLAQFRQPNDMNEFIRRGAKQAKKRSAEARKRLVPGLRHRPDCPARADRIEFYNQIRPDGIEVATVHCLDCGRLHYEHGDAPAGDATGEVKLASRVDYSEKSVKEIIKIDREFPDLVIVAKKPLWFDPEQSRSFSDEKETLIVVRVRITNREPQRNANLTFSLAANVDKPFPRQQELSRAREADKLGLSDPLKVPCDDTSQGDLWFTWSHALDSVYGREKTEREVIDEIIPRLRLTVTDYQSDKAAELNVPGTWRLR